MDYWEMPFIDRESLSFLARLRSAPPLFGLPSMESPACSLQIIIVDSVEEIY